MKNWLLIVWSDIEPEVVLGPTDERAVRQAANLHRRKDIEMKDGLFILTLEADGELKVDTAIN